MSDEADVIAAAVRAALAKGLGVEERRLESQTALYDELGAESLTVLEVLSTLEEQLGIALPPSTEFAMRLRTVEDVVNAFTTRGGR